MKTNFISHNGQACGVMMNQNPNLFNAVNIGSDSFKLMPGPELISNLYRGQNEFYDLCVSSKYRLEGKVEKLIQELRKNEFILLLEGHPVITELNKMEIYGDKFQTDYEGLAQHYGFATEHLDLTNDKDVAMFFATTKFNTETQKYEVIEKDNESVLYTISYVHPDVVEKVNIVGAQALPRPALQKAFSMQLKASEDFNKLPFVKYEKFICTKDLSEHYFHKFEGGSKIFPDDIMDKKAKQVEHNQFISVKAIEMYFEIHQINSEKEQNKIIDMLDDLEIKEKSHYLTKRELSSIRKDWNKKRMAFFDKMNFRLSHY